jgi:hypothetical protein
MDRGAAGAWVTIETRRGDGRVSARRPALLSADGPGWAWWTPAGTSRSRPWRSGEERLRCDEVVIAGDGHRLLTLAMAPGGTPRRALVVDLARGAVRVRDEDDLARNARAMGYPAWLIGTAWEGVRDASARLAEGRWPFDDLPAAVAVARTAAPGAHPGAGQTGAAPARMGGR